MASKTYRNVMLLSESTEGGTRAARHAVELVSNEGAALTVVAVVDTDTLKTLVSRRIFIEEEMAEYESEIEKSSQKQLNYAISLAQKAKVKAEPVLLRGAWHSAVLSEQKKRAFDLIVMAGFKASMSKRDLIAREKQLILDEVGCPVLLVR
jgi:nucleotide-binding universal stress UspA family protein